MSTAGPGLVPPNAAAILRPSDTSVSVATALAAAVLAGSSTGSMVLAALLVGVAARDRRSGAAALLAVAATAVRFRTASFDDLAGIQSVLGPAGTVGPATAAASAWVAAAALVLAAGSPSRVQPHAATGRVDGVLAWLPLAAPALACGLLAAATVAGTGPDQLGTRIAASVAAVLVAALVTVGRTRRVVDRVVPWVAVAAGGVAVVLAGWPS